MNQIKIKLQQIEIIEDSMKDASAFILKINSRLKHLEIVKSAEDFNMAHSLTSSNELLESKQALWSEVAKWESHLQTQVKGIDIQINNLRNL